jgi:hypothetical protein
MNFKFLVGIVLVLLITSIVAYSFVTKDQVYSNNGISFEYPWDMKSNASFVFTSKDNISYDSLGNDK